MPPKKIDPKAGGKPSVPVTTITEDELNEAAKLPKLNDFVFTNLFAFRMLRNETRLSQQIGRLYTYFDKEDPDYSDELAAKYRSIDIDQLLGQAAARGLITADEQAEPSTIEEPRRTEVLAQATMESVVAVQLDARRKKVEAATAKGEESVKSPPGTPGDGDGRDAAGATPMDMAVLLKDFPKNANEVDALLKVGGELNCAFLIEELFGRDIDNSDEEDEINAKRELDILGPVPEVEEGADPPPREKLFKGLKHRADRFEELITINRVAKKAGKDFMV